jgi:hypothetical protein
MRIHVYDCAADPAKNQPIAFYPKERAVHLVAMGRAVICGSRSIKLLALDSQILTPAVISAIGYDNAMNSGPAKFFAEVWEVRSSGGVPVWQLIRGRRLERGNL